MAPSPNNVIDFKSHVEQKTTWFGIPYDENLACRLGHIQGGTVLAAYRIETGIMVINNGFMMDMTPMHYWLAWCQEKRVAPIISTYLRQDGLLDEKYGLVIDLENKRIGISDLNCALALARDGNELNKADRNSPSYLKTAVSMLFPTEKKINS